MPNILAMRMSGLVAAADALKAGSIGALDFVGVESAFTE